MYGHPYHEKSNFILSKYLLSPNAKSYDTHDYDSYESYFENNKKINNDYEQDFKAEASPASSEPKEKRSDNEETFSDYENDNEQESILVTILFHLIKFLAEVIL